MNNSPSLQPEASIASTSPGLHGASVRQHSSFAGSLVERDRSPAAPPPQHAAGRVKFPTSVDRSTVFAQYERAELLPPPKLPPQVVIERESFSLADLEAIALANNPTLAQAAARVEAARGRQIQAGLFPNPVFGYHGMEMGNQQTAGQQGAFLRQQIITGGKRRLDQAAAAAQVSETRAMFEAQQQRVLSDLRMRFYDALVAQQRRDLTSELARIVDNLAAASRTLLANRQVSETNLLQAEIEAEQAHITHENAVNEHVAAWRRLAATAGAPMMEISRLAGEPGDELPNYSWEQCFAMAIADSPELQAAAARVRRADIALARARREPIPNVDVMVSVRHHNVTSDDVADVQLGLPLPIFDANQGNILRAQAEWSASQADVQRIELDLQDRLATAYRRYVNALHQAHRYSQRILPRAKKSLDIVTGAYETGQVDYLTLITAQRTFIGANLAYLDSLRELRQAVSLIEGRLLSNSLGDKR